MGVNQVIEVLNFGNGPESAQGHSNALAQNGGFPDSGIGNTVGAVFFLHSLHPLVYIPQLAGVLSKCYQVRVFFEKHIEITAQDF